MTHNIYLYIIVAATVSGLIRILPLTLIRGKIKNQFVRSFLHYVPYVTLAVMTFPAILAAPQLPLAGILALTAGIAAAWRGMNMMGIAALCCVIVFICETVLTRILLICFLVQQAGTLKIYLSVYKALCSFSVVCPALNNFNNP